MKEIHQEISKYNYPQFAFFLFKCNIDIHKLLQNGNIDPKRIANYKVESNLIKISISSKEEYEKITQIINKYNDFIKSLQELNNELL